MSIKPELKSFAVVIVGGFNPRIFHPTWFEKHGLITSVDENSATVSPEGAASFATTNNFAQFKADWLSVFVDEDRLQLSTTYDAYFEELVNLAMHILELLPHIPVRALGINNDAHFKIANEENWHKLGHTLVPKKDIWDGVMDSPGMMAVTVRESIRRDKRAGYLDVRVAPSGLLMNLSTKTYGIYVHMNDHYDLNKDPKSDSMQELKDILVEAWDLNQVRWKEITNRLTSLV